MRSSKKILFSALSIVLLTCVGLLYSFRPDWFPHRRFFPGKDYKEYWAKVDSLESAGLTESASKEVNTIYELAHKDHNTPQIVKTMLYKMKYSTVLEEEAFRKNFEALDQEIQMAQPPLKQILYSIRGQMLWTYYQQNRYRFSNRSELENTEQNNVLTWNLEKITQETIYSYEQSLQNAPQLKNIPLEELKDILREQESYRYLRPTLYDFLANRALDFFAGSEPDLTRPAVTFVLDKPEYFAGSDRFISMSVTTPDSMETKFYAVKILQDLLAFHKNDRNPGARVDADIRRLKFIKSYSVLPDNDSLYLTALIRLKKDVSGDSASAMVAYEIALQYSVQASQWNAASPDQSHRYDLQKALQVCDESIAAFPGSLGGKNCLHLRETILAPALQLMAEYSNPSGTPFRLRVSYKNTQKVYVKIVAVDYDRYRKEFYNQGYPTDTIIRYLLTQKTVREGNTVVKDPGDHQMHSTELPVLEMSYGYYFVLVSDNPEFDVNAGNITHADFWITDFAPMLRYADDYNENELAVRDRTEGSPLQKVTVNVYKDDYNYTLRKNEFNKVTSTTTNSLGYAKIPSVGGNQYNYLTFELVKGKDRYVSRNGFYQYNKSRENEPYRTTHFFTDRGIYRPGQTIHFKGLVTQTSGKETKILPDHSTTVYLYDANYQPKAEMKVKTNDYGTYAGSFTIPQGELTGEWHIQDNYGTTYFAVEEYKRPKFEVNFDTLKGNYRLNENVEVKGLAKSYAGYGIDGAKVTYRVTRTVNIPYWKSFYYIYPQTYSETEIANGTAVTDEKGNFKINFKALPDPAVSPKTEPYFTYTVSVDITDITGETRSNSTYVYAGYKSMIVTVALPDQVSREDTTRYMITTTNLAGTSTPAKGKITLTKLGDFPRLMRKRNWEPVDQPVLGEEEFVKLFPHDIYDREDEVAKLPKEQVITSFGFDTHTNTFVRASDLKGLAPGRYLVSASSVDPFGETVSFEKYIVVYETANAKTPVNEYQWSVAVKNYGEPGEKAQFLIGSAAISVQVLYEIEQDKKIIYQEIITLNDEQRLIEIPITEAHRGNFSVHFSYVKDNRTYVQSHTVTVPFSNKELDLKFITFRDKLLPGQKEEWKIAVAGPDKEKIAAELLASMYDASLDAFRANSWYLSLERYHYQTKYWQSTEISQLSQGYGYTGKAYITTPLRMPLYESMNLFGFYLIDPYQYMDNHFYGGFLADEISVTEEKSMDKDGNGFVTKMRSTGDVTTAISQNTVTFEKDDREEEQSNIHFIPPGGETAATNNIRSNFEETAFFYPQLETNEKGEFIFSFTIPESLTEWKFQGLAHTKDLKTGRIEKTVVTQKDLMITAFAPRFLRENDKLVFTAKVTNLSDHDLKGQAELQLLDALTLQPVDGKMGNKTPKVSIDIKKGQSAQVEWNLTVPPGLEAVTYRIMATAGDHSDGEEMTIPVLFNSMLVTESLPLPVNGNTTRNFSFDKLVRSGGSATMRHHKLTLEFTSNPAWYAVQSLPYLMEFPHECSEQTFNRMYANSIATHIANSDPRIRQVFDTWKNFQPNALLSNLEKNQELKAVMLEETPWVMDANDETERKRRIAVLFDLNRMQHELAGCVRKLNQMQVSNGGWPWFAGGPDNRYITQYIVSGFGHLKKLGIATSDATVTKMVRDGITYLDARIREDYDALVRHKVDLDEKHISQFQIQYLYARSFFTEIAVDEKSKKAFDYYLGQSKKFWTTETFYMRGMIALANFRYDDKKLAEKIVKSLKENAIYNEEMGMYWKQASGLYWHEAPIETQALLIEAFDEIADDQESIEKMKTWLLKHKQTNDWNTTKATAEACYALLLKGTSQLTDNAYVVIKMGGMTIDPANDNNLTKEAGTGYFKTSWDGSQVKPEMGNVTVTKSSKGVAWGAVYWQYFEQLDKITSANTPVKITKKLFRQKPTDRGPVLEPVGDNTTLHVGDRVKVRVEIFVDRDMEFVHLKDMRASSFEPENVLSGYRYQDGLYYYESTRDAATHFFIDYLPKGAFVFEYPVRVTHEGNFSNGITTLQCMYAPEFSSHSEGVRVNVQ